MKTRPSLRHGLPYGWWRTDAGRDALALVVLVVVMSAMVVGALGAYFGVLA